MLDVSKLERVLNQQQVLLITGVQSHCHSVLANTDRCRFSSSVDGLGNLRPMGEVSPNNHIVNKISFRVAIAGPLSVNGWKACAYLTNAAENVKRLVSASSVRHRDNVPATISDDLLPLLKGRDDIDAVFPLF